MPLLLLSGALAGPLQCPSFADLPEAKANAWDADSGYGEVSAVVWATYAALVPESCVESDCASSGHYSDESCVEVVCTTADGIVSDYVQHDYTEASAADRTEVSRWDLELTAPSALGLGWTSASASAASESLTSIYSYWRSSAVREVSWVGVLDAAYDPDVSARYERGSGGDMYGSDGWVRWDDGTCSFSQWEATYSVAPGWEQSVSSAGHVAHVASPVECTNGFEGVIGTLDGAFVGEVDPDTWISLPDADGDGVSDAQDCDAADGAVSQCSEEIAYDGIDNDCTDGDRTDVDEDGWSAPDDCDDADASVNPSGLDDPCDGIDQDCDGFDDACGDGDVACGDDLTVDGVDQDCDGLDGPDADGDRFVASDAGGSDCDDGDASIHPGAPETRCDFVDQDCDGHDEREGCGDPRPTDLPASPGETGDTGGPPPPVGSDRSGGCTSAPGPQGGGLLLGVWAVGAALLGRRTGSRRSTDGESLAPR